METEREPGWLDKAIKAAQADMATWPEWMRKTAHFEGTYREGDTE